MCKTGSGKLRNTDAGSRVQRSGRGENLTEALDVRERRKDYMHFVEDVKQGQIEKNFSSQFIYLTKSKRCDIIKKLQRRNENFETETKRTESGRTS
ncbi:MAG: hypothetical protein V8T91_07955 [Ruminococcus sp.]